MKFLIFLIKLNNNETIIKSHAGPGTKATLINPYNSISYAHEAQVLWKHFG